MGPESPRVLADALVGQDDRLSVLADSIDHIVWSTDASGAFNFANARWEEYTRQPLSEADGSGWLALLHPEDRKRTWACFREAIASGKRFECEYRLRRWDGEYRWHLSRAAPHRHASGEIERWVGTCTDVDDLKRADAALRESESRFRDIAENIREVFWLTSADQKIMYVSPAYEDIWGQSVESCYATDLAFFDAVHPDDKESFAAALKSNNEGFGVEYRIVRPDGEIRWIQDRAFPIRDARGSVVRVAGIAEDITARRALESNLHMQSKLLASVNLAIALTDIEGRIVTWNNHAEIVYGWTAEEAIGRNFFEIILLGEASASEVSEIRAALGSGEHVIRDLEVTRRTGHGYGRRQDYRRSWMRRDGSRTSRDPP